MGPKKLRPVGASSRLGDIVSFTLLKTRLQSNESVPGVAMKGSADSLGSFLTPEIKCSPVLSSAVTLRKCGLDNIILWSNHLSLVCCPPGTVTLSALSAETLPLEID